MNGHIEHINDSVVEAISLHVKRAKKSFEATGQLTISGGDQQILTKAARGYARRLRRLDVAVKSKCKTQIADAKTRIFKSFDARLAAILRATEDRTKCMTLAEIVARAEGLSLGKIYPETATFRPEPSKPGSWRPIGLTGINRRAQQLILRDLLAVIIGDSTCDSTVAGAGGERRLFNTIATKIEEGYDHWISLDIRDFFPSLRPAHLKGFPLPKWMIENLVFLPAEAKIVFVDAKKGVNLSEHAILNGHTHELPMSLPYSVDDIGATLKRVRQGLIQGDVCAPQIARTLLGRELQHSLGSWDVVWFSHLDDIAIGARSHSALKTSIEALAYRLKNLPAGPLEFHEHAIRTASEGFEMIGYRVVLRKDGNVHVRPAEKRFNRLRDRLVERWNACEFFKKPELLTVGLAYAKNWYASQQAWTKVEQDGASWAYVAGTVHDCLNEFIVNEFMDGIGNWQEYDIDFGLIGEDDV
jgi:hypothetical protein